MMFQSAPPPTPPIVGEQAPDVAFRRPDGSTLQLSSLRGKIVVLEFGMLACPPCRALEPKLEAMAAKQPDVVFLTVCVDTPEACNELWRRRAKDAKTVFVEDIRQADTSKMSTWKFGYLGYPSLFVIGRDGKMASKYIMEELDTLLPHIGARIAWARAHGQ